MSWIGLRLVRALYHHRYACFYGYVQEQGDGHLDPNIQVYDSWDTIPRQFRSVVIPYPVLNVMFYRLVRRKARLLCLSEDGRHLGAYGWIQDWSIFRARFKILATEGTMLGFFWTAPAMRGQGFYGRMLAHGLALSNKDKPILIATSPDNSASRKGIEKAGFKSLGEWDIRIVLRTISIMRQVPAGGQKGFDGLC